MKIVLASNNKHKINEFNSILSPLLPEYDIELLSLSDIGFTDDIVEDGTTFEENAMIKASAVASPEYISISDDSGIAVDYLNGAPGIFSARYAGKHGDDDANNAKLLKELEGVPYEERMGRYVCAIACVMPSGDKFTVTGYAHGHINDKLVGNGGFGYDPLFIGEGSSLTWGQITAEEKDAISHRRNAIGLFAQELRKRL
ncbi:MAG: RdgB/HAM1 family non-canonical purine NTP pyrophosphatase [Clostridia bacterium]|nr:RdgB/HAM1 family non-canonical purine NTP pyrophosphatase [Clostridia bacterium]